ncbi:hypothetical protein CKK33_15375 [Mucilaginibacter sp. MD40]|uniref:sensor histidine kinase n=1 Tax=Mucilaginibacter sp. MD40 TaxID=2029590 RepID=UPI000BACD9BD|nr:HAMP domain-containing sensor histidine kinase [Mucilaginibacter sp. MD40]PAW94798.1 hypothetical protein CKK33_15375 [Mucilaginibacter sp. MD40]
MHKSPVVKRKIASQLQQLLIAFLVLILVLVAGAFILKSNLSKKLSALNGQLNLISAPVEIDSVLLALNSAENDFQKACLNGDAASLNSYKQAVGQSLTQVDRILKQSSQGKKAGGALVVSLNQRIAFSQQLFRLRQLFDSLMKATTAASLGIVNTDTHQPRLQRYKADTLVSTKDESSKAGFFTRLKDAIRNKTTVKVMTIREKAGANPAGLSPAQQATLQRAVRSLNKQYTLMGRSSQQLIANNLQMLSELRQMTEQVRKAESEARQKLQKSILQQYNAANTDMDRFTNIGLALLLLFTLLLIFYIQSTMRAEREYLLENERTVLLAGQKSEILAIMSHEIRNKLTAINGAIFMLKRSNLQPEQLKKVESVGYSSSLLLETVNNVLDVSKIEHGSTEILRNQPFRPLEALKEAVEAMRFSAEKNGLETTLNLLGDEEQVVNGDALRLKQVVINIMGNAIKFTKAGGITINGKLNNQVQQPTLLVTITDTGIGIDATEQSKLFTRYYQGGKDEYKPGTGLGLYLCRRLIELQGGSIGLKSKLGEGSTVEFVIPYQSV